MIITVTNFGGKKTLIVTCDEIDLRELNRGRPLSVDVTGMLGVAMPQQIIVNTDGETAIDVKATQ